MTTSIHDLKREMNTMEAEELVELCTRLARFKKENKELLSFLLFESNDIDGYISKIKVSISEAFVDINMSNVYLIKKSVRKILRNTNKFIKYAGSVIVEVEVLIHFCRTFKKSKIPVGKSPALLNIYEGQLKKITKSILMLHEDLQYDYQKMIEEMIVQLED